MKTKKWLLTDEEYDRLNPRDDIFITRDKNKELRAYYEFIDSDEWTWVDYIPTPKTYIGWFLYHIIHGVWMKYPFWKVILFSLDKDNYSRLSIKATEE